MTEHMRKKNKSRHLHACANIADIVDWHVLKAHVDNHVGLYNMYICIDVSMCVSVYMYICTYVCVCRCVCICIYIYIYVYVYVCIAGTHSHLDTDKRAA